MPVELTKVVDHDADDIGVSASVATNLHEQIHAAGVQATREIFTENILPEAKALCPVGTVDAQGRKDPHPGQNRDSLKVSFRDRIQTGWISAWLFSESGHGWLIEHGTSHNRALTKLQKSRRHGKTAAADRTPAKPYIYPAIRLYVAKIAERAREILESL